MSDTDGLYDTSEEAIQRRLARLGLPLRPLILEDPVERAMMGLICAVEDLDGALLLVRSPEAHATIRTIAEDAIARLLTIETVSLTLEQMEGRNQ